MIDAAKFAAFAPKALPGARDALAAAAASLGIVDALALAHWLGQMRVESDGFAKMTENLNYSVEGLLKTFGRDRISAADCERLGRTPQRKADQEKIANLIYGGDFGRRELGNTEPGDGWKFRGGGFKQITGRANFREAGHEFDPDALRTNIRVSAAAAANFFVKHGCLAPAMRDDVRAVTKIVNGGYNGLDARIAATQSAKRVVGLL